MGKEQSLDDHPTPSFPFPEVGAHSWPFLDMSTRCGQDSVFSPSFPLGSLPSGGCGSVSQPQPLKACFSWMAVPRGSICSFATWGISAIPLKPNWEENDNKREQIPSLRRREGFINVILTYFSFPLHSRRIHTSHPLHSCPPVNWSFQLCASAVLCSSLLSLLSRRSAKLVPRELFSTKLKISISLCLLLETWSLPWQKGQ